MLIRIHRVKLYAQCFTRGKAICSLLNVDCSFVLIAIHGANLYAFSIHGMKLYAHSYTWSEAFC